MRLFILAVALFATTQMTVSLASSCSAKNDAGGSCSIDCGEGQKAYCQDASGGSTPECECKSALIKHDFQLEKSQFKTFNQDSTQEAAISSTNAATSLNQILASQRDVKLQEICTKVPTGEQSCRRVKMPCSVPNEPVLMAAPIRETMCSELECRAIYRDACTVAVGKLMVTGPITAATDVHVNVEEPNWDGIPVKSIARKLTYLNCSQAEQSQNFAYTQEIITGGRVVMTKAIENTTTNSFKLGFSYKYSEAVSVSGEASTSFSRKVSFSDLQEQNFQEKSSISENFPVKIPAQTAVEFEIAWKTIEVPIKFSGTAIVDANVSTNLESILVASQLVPSSKDRSIQFEGIVFDSNVFGASIKNIAKPVQPSDCKGKEGNVELLSNESI